MAKKRIGITKKTRFEVFKRDSFTCQYCGNSAPSVVLHIDHIQPVSKDGDNDLFNLITSCVDCNVGKKDRLLSDDSVVAKQKAQLDDLQERREQIEMMLEWRENLKALKEDVNQIAVDAFNEITPGWTVNENGAKTIAKLIKTHGLESVLSSIDTASDEYIALDEEGRATSESVDLAFSKLGGICRLQSMPDWRRQIYYLRGILRNRVAYCSDWEALQLLEQAHAAGVDMEFIGWLVRNVSSWTKFKNQIIQAINDTQSE